MSGIRFGVNYTPSKNWKFFLLDYNEADIKEDLEQIKSLGMDHLRVCLVWSIAQPAEHYISEHIMENLERFIVLAGQYELDVVVSVLCGWISGFTYLPAFRKEKNVFTDAEMIAAEKQLLGEVARRSNKYDNFLGIDLGNEFNIMEEMGVTHLPTSLFSIEEGDAWLKEMTEYLQALIPGKVCSLGVDHQPWMKDMAFSRELLSNISNPVPLHVYAKFEGITDRFGETSDEAKHALEYSMELAKAFMENPESQIWIQETGACAHWYTNEKEQCCFLKESLEHAVQNAGLWGITLWSSHGTPTRFREFFDWEQGFSLFDENNREKPLAITVKEFIADYKQGRYPIKKKQTALMLKTDCYQNIKVHGNTETILLPDGTGIKFPATPGLEVYAAYLEKIRNNEYPAIVLEDKSCEASYLEQRGISAIFGEI